MMQISYRLVASAATFETVPSSGANIHSSKTQMSVFRAFQEWLERDFFVRTVDRLSVFTARDGAGMAVFNRCGHDGMVEWLLSFR